ncbi:hypothetical protein HI914_05265 [Erysiphe necator]|nr:hypothetical protein HI914_05265 [Erysiphe necator]
MKSSLLATFISILALSLDLVEATNSAPVYDAMGIASNSLACTNQVAYNKRDTYAVVGEAMRLKKQQKFVTVGCQSLKLCRRYPMQFNDQNIMFKLDPPYFMFPILPNKKLYQGNMLSVSDYVIFNEDGEVAGIIRSSLKGNVKCLLDDRFQPHPKNFFSKARYLINYYRGNK